MPSAIGAPVCLPLSSSILPPSHQICSLTTASTPVAAASVSTSTDGPRIEGQGRAEEEDPLNQQQPSALTQQQQQQQLSTTSSSIPSTATPTTTAGFLTSLGLDHLVELFDKEQVSVATKIGLV